MAKIFVEEIQGIRSATVTAADTARVSIGGSKKTVSVRPVVPDDVANEHGAEFTTEPVEETCIEPQPDPVWTVHAIYDRQGNTYEAQVTAVRGSGRVTIANQPEVYTEFEKGRHMIPCTRQRAIERGITYPAKLCRNATVYIPALIPA